ncbi:MAG: hypothetical protein ACYDAG_05605, partial [Chloroflexota bacterium]
RSGSVPGQGSLPRLAVRTAMMDNVFQWNIRGVLRNLHQAEVMSLFFPCLARVLIVDLRSDQVTGPLIQVDSAVGSPRERVESLERLRPGLPAPVNMTIAPWLGSVKSLSSSGALADLADRLGRLDQAAAVADLDRAYAVLLRVEREEVLALIRGDLERTRTLWQR